MADNEQQMVLVAKLVDQISDRLKVIQKSAVETFSAINKAQGGSSAVAQAYQKRIGEVEKTLHNFHVQQMRRTEEQRKQLRDFGEAVKNLISGPSLATVIDYAGQLSLIGLAAGAAYEGIKRMSEAMDRLGDKSLQLKFLSNATGMNATAYQQIERAMTLSGVSQSGAQQGTLAFQDFLQRFKEHQTSAINQMYSGPVHGEDFVAGLDKMSPDKAEETFIRRVLGSKNSAAMKARIFAQYGLPSELAFQTLEGFNEKKAEADKAVAIEEEQRRRNAAAAEETERRKGQQEKLGNSMLGELSPLYEKGNKALGDLFEKLNEGRAHIDERSLLGRLLGKSAPTPGERLNDAFSDLRKMQESTKEGTKQGVIEGFDELRNKLIDEQGGGYKPIAYHPDENGGGRVTGLRSGSGYSLLNQSIGSRGDRNNNPGNIKFGRLAQSFGATGADSGGFAIFPDWQSGAAAQEALLHSDAYHGLTLQQFAQKYAEGNPDWMRTVGSALGIGAGDIVNNNDPRLAGAIRRAEGTHGAAQNTMVDQNGRPFYMHGIGSMEGFGKFHWGSGGAGLGSIPYGDYPITPGEMGSWGYAHGAIGLNHNSIFDPKFGRSRGGIEIHASSSSDLDRLYTLGCFAVAPSEWPAFKRHLLSEIEKSGPMYLHIGKDGSASITHRQKADDLLKMGKQSGLVGGSGVKVSGDASVKIALEGFPRGTRTRTSSSGIFKEVELRRGRSMGLASEVA